MTTMSLGPIWVELVNQGLVSNNPDDIKLFHRGVRDASDINVLKCSVTGVTFLDKISPTGKENEFRKSQIDNAFIEDNERRVQFFKKLKLNNRSWADIGSGSGGLLERLYRNAGRVTAVEPDIKGEVYKLAPAIEVVSHSDQLEDGAYDVITMFHTLEHIVAQKEILEKLKKKISRTFGRLIIEVPHARDLLIETSPSFKAFTFWSEHYVLHTRQSLAKLVLDAGYRDIEVFNIQRYGLANHISWLYEDRSSNYLTKIFESHEMKEADKAYREKLIELGLTDTIMVVCYA